MGLNLESIAVWCQFGKVDIRIGSIGPTIIRLDSITIRDLSREFIVRTEKLKLPVVTPVGVTFLKTKLNSLIVYLDILKNRRVGVQVWAFACRDVY